MDKTKAMTVEQTCRKYGVPIEDLILLLQALAELPEQDTQKILWMATGVAYASATGIKNV